MEFYFYLRTYQCGCCYSNIYITCWIEWYGISEMNTGNSFLQLITFLTVTFCHDNYIAFICHFTGSEVYWGAKLPKPSIFYNLNFSTNKLRETCSKCSCVKFQFHLMPRLRKRVLCILCKCLQGLVEGCVYV